MTERTDLELMMIYDEAFDKALAAAWGSINAQPNLQATQAGFRAVYEQGFQDGLDKAPIVRTTAGTNR